jgi:5-methylthioribose kinase
MKQRNEPRESVPTGNPVKSSSKDAISIVPRRGIEWNSSLGRSSLTREAQRRQEPKRPKQVRQNEERDYRDAVIVQTDLEERRIAALAAARSPSATDQGIEHFKEIVNGK